MNSNSKLLFRFSSLKRLICRLKYVCAAAMALTVVLTMIMPVPVMAEDYLYWDENNAWEYVNEETGYSIMVMDFAELFTPDEEDVMLDIMYETTYYGHAMLLTIDENEWTTSQLSQYYYELLAGSDSGCIFMIDLDNREIYIYTDGEVGKYLSVSNCNTITDNVYRYAKDGDYFGCAYEGYYQVYQLLNGMKIARPMKYISNVLFAVILALLLNFFLAKMMSSTAKASDSDVLDNISSHFNFDNVHISHVHQERIYSPVSSDSDGGGGGGGGGGHGGGHGF